MKNLIYIISIMLILVMGVCEASTKPKLAVYLPNNTITAPRFVLQHFEELSREGWGEYKLNPRLDITIKQGVVIWNLIKNFWSSEKIELNTMNFYYIKDLSKCDCLLLFYNSKSVKDVQHYLLDKKVVSVKLVDSWDTSTITDTINVVIGILESKLSYFGSQRELCKGSMLQLLINKNDTQYPFAFHVEAGWIGYDIKIGKLIADMIGVELKIVEVSATYDDISNLIMKKQGDIAFFISKNPYRLNRVIMFDYIKVRANLLLLNFPFGESRLKLLKRINGSNTTIYTRKGTIYGERANNYFPKANKEIFTIGIYELYNRIQYIQKQPSVILTNEVRLDASNLMNKVRKKPLILFFGYDRFCVIIRAGCPLLEQIVKSVLEDQPKVSYEKLKKTYLSYYVGL